MSKCRSCGAEIIWIKTARGKAMPCDAEPVVYWQQKSGSKTIVLNNGEVIKGSWKGSPGQKRESATFHTLQPAQMRSGSEKG